MENSSFDARPAASAGDASTWSVGDPTWSGDAAVWCVELPPGAADRTGCLASLSPDECGRAQRFLRTEDRDRFVASHSALRLILAGALRTKPETLDFHREPSGKPRLAGAHAGRLHFNLSHSGTCALVGLAPVPIGVDVESMRPIDDLLPIIRGNFHPREIAALEALPPARRQRAFYACWTRKEAVVKAIGGGLTIPLDSFAVSLPPEPPVVVAGREAFAPANWSLHHLEPGAGFVGAAAISGTETAFSRFRLSPRWFERL